MKTYPFLFILCLWFGFSHQTMAWGFFGHKRINRTAVFLLPPEMFGFYKNHIQFITEGAVNPDERRYAVEGEAECHYIDLDHYGDSALFEMPRAWKDAVEKYSEDTLKSYGIVPWHIVGMKYRLTKAFEERNIRKILMLSADIGHYIGDAHVPLHTTENYNGQRTGQHGIHGFWETRLPELFCDEKYDFFLSKAQYIANPQTAAWQAIQSAHVALDSVFRFEKQLTLQWGEERKYSFETRNKITTKVYSEEFSRAYHALLNGQVERQMRSSIQMVANFWFSCWVDAGMPDLSILETLSPEEMQKMQEQMITSTPKHKLREHE